MCQDVASPKCHGGHAGRKIESSLDSQGGFNTQQTETGSQLCCLPTARNSVETFPPPSPLSLPIFFFSPTSRPGTLYRLNWPQSSRHPPASPSQVLTCPDQLRLLNKNKPSLDFPENKIMFTIKSKLERIPLGSQTVIHDLSLSQKTLFPAQIMLGREQAQVRQGVVIGRGVYQYFRQGEFI